MKIYSGDTWTLEELQEQVADAGRRCLVIPPADSKRDVLETFGEVLSFPEHYGVNLDALNDSLHDFADAISDGCCGRSRPRSAATGPSLSSAKSFRMPNGMRARTWRSPPSCFNRRGYPPGRSSCETYVSSRARAWPSSSAARPLRMVRAFSFPAGNGGRRGISGSVSTSITTGRSAANAWSQASPRRSGSSTRMPPRPSSSA